MQHLTDENDRMLQAFLFRQRQSCEVCGGREFMIGRQLMLMPAMVQPETPGIAPGSRWLS